MRSAVSGSTSAIALTAVCTLIDSYPSLGTRLAAARWASTDARSARAGSTATAAVTMKANAAARLPASVIVAARR